MKDGVLFIEMRQAAEALAARYSKLDYSVQSLDALDATLRSVSDVRPTIHDAGAYLGEVLIRHGGFAWEWPPRYGSQRGDEPALRAFSADWVDIFAEVRRRTANHRFHRRDSLSLFAEEILAYTAVPTNETAERLGWKDKYTTRTNGELLRWDYQRMRTWLRMSLRRTPAEPEAR